ncbi:hypothetical protein JL720_6238 [Aureococcus anophagefferens]|nr:hypothetical protein JL720_6238 [Aureococcus anophagefferens]
MAELEAAPGWAALVGDVDDEADGEDADALVHEAALEALESLSAQTESQSLASGESASASSHSGKHHHHHRHHHKKAPGSPGSHHGSHHGHHHLPGASVAAEMAEIIKQDEHVASMMHELPSNPDGLIDAQTGKAQLMSEIVAEHTVRVDLSFPSLESFRRAEHDVAPRSGPGEPDGDADTPPRGRRVPRDAALPGLARDALESSQFAAAAAACAEAAAALAADAAAARANASVATGMPADDARPLIACAIAELVASPAAAMVVDAARAPTAYECDRYCSACAAATRAHFLSVAPEGSEVRPPPVSFAHLAAFCATAARLEHDSGMELVARSEKAALAADDALACLDEPGEHTVKGLLEQEGLLGPAQDKFRDFVTSPAFRAAVQAQTNKQLAKHGVWDAAAARRPGGATLANQAAVRVDVAAATDRRTAPTRRRDTASRFTEFATFALLRAALRERRDDARRDAAAELALDLARCPPSAEQGCLDVVHRLVDLGALPASAARLLGSAELARAWTRRSRAATRSARELAPRPRGPGHQAWDATGRELKLVFDEVAAATDARLPTPKSPDRCALYGALFDARVPAPALAAGPRADRDRARFAYALLLAVLETSRCGGAGGARGRGHGAADVDADAADAADLDFSAAWVALAGRGVESMTPGDCAALLRPFATHWGGAPGAALAARAPRAAATLPTTPRRARSPRSSRRRRTASSTRRR